MNDVLSRYRDLPPTIPSLGTQFPRLNSELVVRHGHQQLQKLLGSF